MDSNPRIYRRYEEIKEHIFSIKLRDLKASETVSVFRDNCKKREHLNTVSENT